MKQHFLYVVPLLLTGLVACSAPPNSEGFSGPIRDCTVYAADLTGRDGEEVSGERRMVEQYEYNERGFLVKQFFEGQITAMKYDENNRLIGAETKFEDSPTSLVREITIDDSGDYIKETLEIRDGSGSAWIKKYTRLKDGSGGYEFTLHDPDTGRQIGHGKANRMGKTTEIEHQRDEGPQVKIAMSYNGALLEQWSMALSHADPAQDTVETETYNGHGDLVRLTTQDGAGKLTREEVRAFSDFDGHGNWRRCVATITENGTERRMVRTRELNYY
jgi:hypothetical protein